MSYPPHGRAQLAWGLLPDEEVHPVPPHQHGEPTIACSLPERTTTAGQASGSAVVKKCISKIHWCFFRYFRYVLHHPDFSRLVLSTISDFISVARRHGVSGTPARQSTVHTGKLQFCPSHLRRAFPAVVVFISGITSSAPIGTHPG